MTLLAGRSLAGLVVFTTEFGRTPFVEGTGGYGRGHYQNAFSSWLAGGGVKGGLVYGSTDDFGEMMLSNKHSWVGIADARWPLSSHKILSNNPCHHSQNGVHSISEQLRPSGNFLQAELLVIDSDDLFLKGIGHFAERHQYRDERSIGQFESRPSG